jgi:hypothetical protein
MDYAYVVLGRDAAGDEVQLARCPSPEQARSLQAQLGGHRVLRLRLAPEVARPTRVRGRQSRHAVGRSFRSGHGKLS